MAKGRVEALLVVTDPTYLLPGAAARLADLAVKSRLPSMHSQRPAVEAGGLMSYGPSIVALFRRAAVYVDKILKGAKPADLPVEQPTKFELVINLKTAKALGLTIPPAVLARADEVIQYGPVAESCWSRLAGALAPLAAGAQPGRSASAGISFDRAGDSPFFEAVPAGSARPGLGRRAQSCHRGALGRGDRGSVSSRMAAELVRLRLHVIVTQGGALSVAGSKHATTTYRSCSDLQRRSRWRGLVESLARPGRNVTGVSFRSGARRQAARAAQDVMPKPLSLADPRQLPSYPGEQC